MPGRKSLPPGRRLTVKNLYLPDDVNAKIERIAQTVTTSAMEVYVQSVRSYFARHREEYLNWIRADWGLSGIGWPEYVDAITNGTLLNDSEVPYSPSPLRALPPYSVTAPVTINWMLLPEQTVFLVRIAARRDRLTISKLVSQLVVWHISQYWDSNYAPLMVDVRDPAFLN